MLLLVLRCIALALLVAAFARPFFERRRPTVSTTGSREVVVLLDRSASMAYADRWGKARAAARKGESRPTPGFFTTTTSPEKGLPQVGQGWKLQLQQKPLSPSAPCPSDQTGPVANPPPGLIEPIFDDQSDIPGPTKSINSANRWAVFVNTAVNRYKPDGVLAMHVSNHYLDLAPVVELGNQGLGKDVWKVVSVNSEPPGFIPVLVDESAVCALAWRPDVIIDARMQKRSQADAVLPPSPLLIGLGPGFKAGVDCHAVIETNRGHDLGRVIWQGQAAPNTNPRMIKPIQKMAKEMPSARPVTRKIKYNSPRGKTNPR